MSMINTPAEPAPRQRAPHPNAAPVAVVRPFVVARMALPGRPVRTQVLRLAARARPRGRRPIA